MWCRRCCGCARGTVNRVRSNTPQSIITCVSGIVAIIVIIIITTDHSTSR